ncbi:MAG: AgmX/PglI C-terminal domain-containing protein [Myxococcota bacterium]|nr:AgmX/PglI C-terminal domain-containing protein [Myxococcota bacterium]
MGKSKHRQGLHLKIFKGDKLLLEETLFKSRISLGRSPSCDLTLPSRHISNLHAYVETRKGAVRISDANSTNGIYVNGEKTQRVLIKADDKITICDLTLTIALGQRPTTNVGELELSGGWEEYLEDDKSSEHTKFVLLDDTEQRSKLADDETSPSVDLDTMPQEELSKESAAIEQEKKSSDEALSDYPDFSWTWSDTAPTCTPIGEFLFQQKPEMDQYGHNLLEVLHLYQGKVINSSLIKPSRFSQTWLGSETSGNPIAGVVFQKGQLTLLVNPHGHWSFSLNDKAMQNTHFTLKHGDALLAQRGQRQCLLRPTAPPRGRLVNKHNIKTYQVPFLSALVISFLLHMATFAFPHEAEQKQLAFIPVPKTIDWMKVSLRQEPIKPLPKKEELEETPKGFEIKAPQKRAETPREPKKSSIKKEISEGTKTNPTIKNTFEQKGEMATKPTKKNTSDLSDFKVAGYLGHLPTLQPLSQSSPLSQRSGMSRWSPGRANRPALIKDAQSTTIRFGKIDMAQLIPVINSQAHQIEQCYLDALQQFSLPSGIIRLKWTVSEIGQAQSVNVLRNDVGSRNLVECMSKTLRTWNFPVPEGGAAEVSFSFRFSNPNF